MFRLIVSEAPDLTTVRVIGRLRDDGVVILDEACAAARGPLVLDLSELTGASDAGARLLGRLSDQGAHLVGASPYVRLLLSRGGEPSDQSASPSRPRSRSGGRASTPAHKRRP